MFRHLFCERHTRLLYLNECTVIYIWIRGPTADVHYWTQLDRVMLLSWSYTRKCFYLLKYCRLTIKYRMFLLQLIICLWLRMLVVKYDCLLPWKLFPNRKLYNFYSVFSGSYVVRSNQFEFQFKIILVIIIMFVYAVLSVDNYISNIDVYV